MEKYLKLIRKPCQIKTYRQGRQTKLTYKQTATIHMKIEKINLEGKV